MNPSQAALEEQREQAIDQMRSIDRMRRGSLSRQFFKQQQDGQTITRGPYFLLQGFFHGKKFAERIPAEEAAQVEEQVQSYQTFQALAERVVTLTDQITRLAGATKEGKKLQPQEIAAERFRETETFLKLVQADLAKNGVRNMEAVELGLREAIHKDARRVLEGLYEDAHLTMPNQAARPGEKRHAQRLKQVQTVFGPITLRRDYLYCEATDQGRAPLDEALGLRHSYSPALVRLACRAAARMGFEHASQDLAALANIHLEGRQIQRLVNHAACGVAAPRSQVKTAKDASAQPLPLMYVEVDGTGVPMKNSELVGRPGKQPDGSAKTREVKLGCVFTQAQCDSEGNPMRDYQSTTYVGSFETASEFGPRIRAEAFRRGLGRAQRVVFLGDGAAWIWELARVNFPDAVQILDQFHALQRLHELCEGLYGAGSTWAERRHEQWAQMLKADLVLEVIAAARTRLFELGPRPDDLLEKQIAYFQTHHQRMLYLTYHNQGFFCGSGVVEAGCKAVIGQRLKHSGMFWSESGADSILALRCLLMSNLWDPCWDRLHSFSSLVPALAA